MLPRLQNVQQNAEAQAHTKPAKRVSAHEVLVPLAVGLVIAMVPVPAGLSVNAWRYFALFATVIVALITEPIPPARLPPGGPDLNRGSAHRQGDRLDTSAGSPTIVTRPFARIRRKHQGRAALRQRPRARAAQR